MAAGNGRTAGEPTCVVFRGYNRRRNQWKTEEACASNGQLGTRITCLDMRCDVDGLERGLAPLQRCRGLFCQSIAVPASPLLQ
jgi:hypothetical protein